MVAAKNDKLFVLLAIDAVSVSAVLAPVTSDPIVSCEASHVTTTVPLLPGNVIVVAPATAAALTIVLPDVEPARMNLSTAPPMVPKVLAPVTV